MLSNETQILEFEEFTAEKDRTLSELKRPTPADLEVAVQRKEHWVATFRIDEEYEAILKTYREKAQASAN